MKQLLVFLFPTIKAIVGVISILFTAVSISYGGMVLIARGEARTIGQKMIAVRNADMEHINIRFDDTQKMLRELKRDIRSLRK